MKQRNIVSLHLSAVTNGAIAVCDALTPAAGMVISCVCVFCVRPRSTSPPLYTRPVFAAPALAAVKMLLQQVQLMQEANELRKAVVEVRYKVYTRHF